MGRKSNENLINITPLVFKDPKSVINAIMSSVEGIQVTKVIQTFVLENDKLEINVGRNGKVIFSGIVKWIGNRTDGTRGAVFCAQEGSKGSGEFRLIIPTEDTAQVIGLDTNKSIVKIKSKESVKCSVCGKGIRIFDEVLACPLCNSKAHLDHLKEWISMRHSCPICKKSLTLDSENNPIPMD